MHLAGKRANALSHPVILDPVGAGASGWRREAALGLLEEVKCAVIRGNASEIKALALGRGGAAGVDADLADEITPQNLEKMTAFAKAFAEKTGAVVAVSGPIDVVTDGGQTILLRNGCATMARITGSGCMLTSLLGAFCGADPGHPFEATCAAIAAMGVAGDLAEERRLRNGTGNATFRTDLIDAVFNLTEEQLNGRVRYEVYEG